jgi:predicted ferric reductase
MRPFNEKLVWGMYIIGMIISINAMFINLNLLQFAIAAIIILVVLILILKDLWSTTSTNKWLWTIFLIPLAGVAIPMYLLSRKTRLRNTLQ